MPYKIIQTLNLLDPQSLRYVVYPHDTVFEVQFLDDPSYLSPDRKHSSVDKVLLRTYSYPPRLILVSMDSFHKYFSHIHYYEADKLIKISL